MLQISNKDLAIGFLSTLAGFALLFPLWSNSGVFWDGWIYQLMIFRDNFEEGILEPFQLNGRSFSAYLIYAFSIFENPSWAALILSCLGIAIGGGFFYLSIRKLDLLPARYAALAVILGIVFPAYEISLSLSSINFQLAVFLFYVGMYFAVSSYVDAGGRRLIDIVVASLFLFLSFSGEAAIVLSGWIPVFGFAYFLKQGRSIYKCVISVLRQSAWLWALLILTVVPWIIYFAPSGNYEGARFESFNVFKAGLIFIKFWLLLFHFGTLGLIGLAVAAGVFWWKKRRVHLNWIIAVPFVLGVVGFLLSMFPYIVGGRFPHSNGWSLRFLMFSGFPMGMLLAGLCYAWAQLFEIRTRALVWILGGLFLVGQFYHLARHSIDWHMRWIRDYAIIEAMRDTVKPETGLVLIRDDQTTYRPEVYRDYELVSMAQFALDRITVFAAPWKKVEQLGYAVDSYLTSYAGDTTYTPFITQAQYPQGCQIVRLNSDPWYAQSRFAKLKIVMKGVDNQDWGKVRAALGVEVMDCGSDT